MTDEPIIFYCKSTCPWCHAVHDLLSTHGVPFDERAIDLSAECRAELRRETGQEEIPTLKIGDDWLINTDARLVAARLGLPRPAHVKLAHRRSPARGPA